MQKDKIKYIETKSRDILENILGQIETISNPVDLAKILKHLNLHLSIASFKNNSVAGAFDKDQRTIFISKFDSPKRQAFTIAHELGHFILHQKPQDVLYRVQSDEFNGSPLDLEEKEANWFAASLLMPKELVEKFWHDKQDIELLAAYFGVSRSAAFWRLKNLNLI